MRRASSPTSPPLWPDASSIGNGSGADGAEHLDARSATTSISPVGEVGVLVAGLAGHDLAGDLEAELAAQAVRDLLVADDDLHDAAGLAQVEERDPAVVAAPRHPSGEGDGLADVLGAQGAGVMGADHWFSSDVLCGADDACGRRSASGGVQVAGSASTCSPERMSLTWWVPSAWTNQTNGMPRRSA